MMNINIDDKSLPPLTDKQREAASKDLTQHYLSTYFCNWRLTKMLSIEKMLNERYDFFAEIKTQVRQLDDESGDATIGQEIKNGLYFEAISTCLQYCEDLFAMLKASSNPAFFIRDMITYQPGAISKYISEYNLDVDNVQLSFHIPSFELGKENKLMVEEALIYQLSLLTSIRNFYSQYKFIYNKYKHGLSVALRPFGKMMEASQVELDKTEDFKPYLLAYDNLNLVKAIKKGGFSGKLLMMPCLTPNIAPYIGQLIQEDNLLRTVPIENIVEAVDMQLFVNTSRMINVCLKSFITNYASKTGIHTNPKEFQIPTNFSPEQYIIGTYSVE